MLGLIAEGAIGDVRHVRSRRLSWGRLRAQENVWWSFAPHDIALTLEIFGSVPDSVKGVMSAFVRPQIADFAYADLMFGGGRTAHIEVSWLDPDKASRLDVFGSKGVLRLTDSRAGAELTLTPCGDNHVDRGHVELWREDSHEISFSASEPLAAEMQAFIDAVTAGTRPMTDGEEGLRVVQVLTMLASNNDFAHPSLEAVS
jgi:predicted dehydrogenase